MSARGWAEAERASGRRLDRRRSYVVCDGEALEVVRIHEECTACDGYGCQSCAGHGRRNRRELVPVVWAGRAPS